VRDGELAVRESVEQYRTDSAPQSVSVHVSECGGVAVASQVGKKRVQWHSSDPRHRDPVNHTELARPRHGLAPIDVALIPVGTWTSRLDKGSVAIETTLARLHEHETTKLHSARYRAECGESRRSVSSG
jgi:hypothetical protein